MGPEKSHEDIEGSDQAATCKTGVLILYLQLVYLINRLLLQYLVISVHSQTCL